MREYEWSQNERRMVPVCNCPECMFHRGGRLAGETFAEKEERRRREDARREQAEVQRAPRGVDVG